MQVRFREYDEEKKEYDLIGYTDIKEFDIAFKMFTFMKDHECSFCLECNTSNTTDTLGECYRVKDVSFVFPAIGKDIRGHIAVDVEMDF